MHQETLPARVVLLCGPPCAGKTTRASELARDPDDVVVDFDQIARDLGSPARWLHPEPYRWQAEQEVRRILARLPGTAPGTAYVIRSLPGAQQRAIAARTIRACETWVISPGRDVCVCRAEADHRPAGTVEQIDSWYARYRPWSGDHRASRAW
ncbi:AAA family ATPase [Actinokineospora sp. UTMC 2448]|uniref:AAA family ATPase n=1 Tax=Actinokineospora sp. UTMC 2448 TaxID=2268449 RepID=UPI002164EA6E|nr:AAA family ATPase [Actinokineospora sp. UTMC 2448]UVS81831.1 hypothetical protein Actkin_05595 [Actinokineospora sp. UTMC 2448]